MLPLRIRRIERVRLHLDLTVLAKLACRLASERALAVAATGRSVKVVQCGGPDVPDWLDPAPEREDRSADREPLLVSSG